MTNTHLPGDTVRIKLSIADPLYIEYHDALATVHSVSGNSCVVRNSFGTITVSASELERAVTPPPAEPPAFTPVATRHHVIELDDQAYIELLQLAFRYGNVGSALSETTVAAIAYAQTKYV